MSGHRALLEREERHYDLPPGAFERLVHLRERRRRTRQITAVAFTLLLLAAAIGGSIVVLRDAERQIPIGPDESPAPSSTLPVPVVVSGSGLDGYVATTFPTVGTLGDLTVAPAGTLWVAPGVASFDGETETWTTYTTGGLPGGWASTVEVAPDGTVWAGTERGLARLDGQTWTIVSPPVEILDLAFAPDGTVVAGFLRPPRDPGWGGVARFDGETWNVLGDADTMPEDFLTFLDVSPVDGAVWTTAGGSGFIPVGTVSRFEGSGWTGWPVNEFPGHEELPGLIPQAMNVGTDGSVWVVTHKGDGTGLGTLARFDGVTWKVFSVPAGAAVDAWGTMAIGPDGTVWLAGNERPATDEYEGLLFSFDGVSWTRDRVGNEVSALEVAPDGTLWVGVDGSLVRFTPTHP